MTNRYPCSSYICPVRHIYVETSFVHETVVSDAKNSPVLSAVSIVAEISDQALKGPVERRPSKHAKNYHLLMINARNDKRKLIESSKL